MFVLSILPTNFILSLHHPDKILNGARSIKVCPMHLKPNCSLWLSKEMHRSIFSGFLPRRSLLGRPNLILTALPRGKTLPMQMALIWSNVGGKYNSWNSRNTNPTKCTIHGKLENRLICTAAVQHRPMSRWGPAGLRLFPRATVLLCFYI